MLSPEPKGSKRLKHETGKGVMQAMGIWNHVSSVVVTTWEIDSVADHNSWWTRLDFVLKFKQPWQFVQPGIPCWRTVVLNESYLHTNLALWHSELVLRRNSIFLRLVRNEPVSKARLYRITEIKNDVDINEIVSMQNLVVRMPQMACALTRAVRNAAI